MRAQCTTGLLFRGISLHRHGPARPGPAGGLSSGRNLRFAPGRPGCLLGRRGPASGLDRPAIDDRRANHAGKHVGRPAGQISAGAARVLRPDIAQGLRRSHAGGRLCLPRRLPSTMGTPLRLPTLRSPTILGGLCRSFSLGRGCPATSGARRITATCGSRSVTSRSGRGGWLHLQADIRLAAHGNRPAGPCRLATGRRIAFPPAACSHRKTWIPGSARWSSRNSS